MAQLTKVERKLANSKAHIQVTKNNLKDVLKDIEGALEQKGKIKEETNQLTEMKEELVSFSNHLCRQINIKELQIKAKKATLKHRELAVEKLQKDSMSEIAERKAKIKADEQIHKKEILRLISKIKDLREETETLQYECEMMTDALDDMDNMVEEAKREVVILQAKSTAIKHTTQEYTKDIQKAKKELKAVKDEIKENQEKVRNPFEALAEKEEELERREKAMTIQITRLRRMVKVVKDGR